MAKPKRSECASSLFICSYMLNFKEKTKCEEMTSCVLASPPQSDDAITIPKGRTMAASFSHPLKIPLAMQIM